MKKVLFSVVFAVWGICSVFAEASPNPCDPCDAALFCDTGSVSAYETGGWAEFGLYVNSHGAKFNEPGELGNGMMHVPGNRRTDFHLDQLYLYHTKKADTRHGFDFGYNVAGVYGTDASGLQSYGNDSFDAHWDQNRHGYGFAFHQLNLTLGYKAWQVRIGKYNTPIGIEFAASAYNFFYSHSYCFWIEPATFSGVMVDYTPTDRLSITLGWTPGRNAWMGNKYGDDGFLGGAQYKLSSKLSVNYWLTFGRWENAFRNGQWRLDDTGRLTRRNHFLQSMWFEWTPNDRWTWRVQYDLNNMSDVERNTIRTIKHHSAYGVNNHLLYRVNDAWQLGLRLEWLRDNGGYVVAESANYFEATFGVNWTPNKHLSFRPEIRYDRVMDGAARPYGDGTHRDQLLGGIGMLLIF